MSWTGAGYSTTTTITASWTLGGSPDVSSQELYVYSDASCSTQSGSAMTGIAAATTSQAFTVGSSGFYWFKVKTIDNAGNQTFSSCSTNSIDVTTSISIAIDTNNNQTAIVGASVASPFIAIVKDASNNPIQGVSITWTLTGGSGSFTTTSTTTGSDGKASASGLVVGVGTNTVNAAVTADGSKNVSFTATGIYKLIFVASPSDIRANATMSAVQVAVANNSNTVVTSGTYNITLALSGSSPSGTLSGTLTKTVDTTGSNPRIATFSDLSIDRYGSNFALTATSSSLSLVTSSNFNGTLALNVIGPTTLVPGFCNKVTVSLKDGLGNFVAPTSGSIALNLSLTNSNATIIDSSTQCPGGTTISTLSIPTAPGTATLYLNPVTANSSFTLQVRPNPIDDLIENPDTDLSVSIAASAPTSGDYDTSFNSTGSVAIAASNGTYGRMALQPNGAIILSGYRSNGTDEDFGFMRYTSAGVLDTTFGTSGKTYVDFGSNDRAVPLAIQPDGKIIGGSYTTVSSVKHFALVRLTANGAVDTTFGTNGKLTTPVGTGDASISQIALQSDGKIVAAGIAVNGSYNEMVVARYTSAGVLDTSFGTNGITLVNFFGFHTYANGIVMQTDGKIIVSGYAATDSANTTRNMVAARFTSSGALDTTFNTTGKISLAPNSSTSFSTTTGRALLEQKDGKLVIAGHINVNATGESFVARYTTAGALDTTWNTTGVHVYDFSPFNEIPLTAVQQPDNKILWAGRTDQSANLNSGVTRYTTAGAIDTTFGTSGTKEWDIPNTGTEHDNFQDVLLTADHKILLLHFTFIDASAKLVCISP